MIWLGAARRGLGEAWLGVARQGAVRQGMGPMAKGFTDE